MWIRNLSIYKVIRWLAGPMGQTTRRPSVWCSKYYFFFHNFLQILKKSFNLFFYNFTKIKIKSFECPKSKPATHCFISIYQNNTWTIRCLGDETIDPATQHIILKIIILKIVVLQKWCTLHSTISCLNKQPPFICIDRIKSKL